MAYLFAKIAIVDIKWWCVGLDVASFYAKLGILFLDVWVVKINITAVGFKHDRKFNQIF